MQGRGSPLFERSQRRNAKDGAQRRSAQAKRGRLGKPLRRARAAPLVGILIWLKRKIRSTLTLYQSSAAARLRIDAALREVSIGNMQVSYSAKLSASILLTRFTT